MAQDANLILQASVTKTATFNGAWLALPGGTPPRGLWAHVFYSAASNASGANAVVFSLDVSPDGGTTTYSAEFAAADQPVNLTTTAQAGEIVIPFDLQTPGMIQVVGGSPSIRLTATVSGAGTVPTITYSGAVEMGLN